MSRAAQWCVVQHHVTFTIWLVSMPKVSTELPSSSSASWEHLESFARAHVQGFIQRLLDQEVEELLGRAKSERREPDAPLVYRNGYGKPRKLALSNGTITVQRPHVRGLEERFESRLLPLFKRRTEAVAGMLPKLYLHGLALGDFELALRGLLGRTVVGGLDRTAESAVAGRVPGMAQPIARGARHRLLLGRRPVRQGGNRGR